MRAFAEDAPGESSRPGLIKRSLDSLLADDEDKEGKDGRGLHLGPFAPRIDIVSSGAGPAPILHFWTPDIGGTPVDLHASASYSAYKYQYYDAQLGLIPHEGEHLPRIEKGTSGMFPLSDLEKTAAAPGFNVYASARLRDYPREDFFGIGPASLRAGRSDYHLKDALYEGIVRVRLGRLALMGRAGLLETTIGPGADSKFPNTELLNDEGTAPGLLSSPDFLHVSAGGWLELRDQPENPHRGAALGASYSRFDDRGGDAFQFARVLVDARQYLPLFSDRHVLAFRQVTVLDTPDAGGRVPFYMHTTLGGSTFLRGYDSFRFRDDKLLALAGEYRFELRPKVELALIYQAGKVFRRMGQFDLSDLRNSWGAGLRIKTLRKVKVRCDVLRSAEGTRVHVKLGPSF